MKTKRIHLFCVVGLACLLANRVLGFGLGLNNPAMVGQWANRGVQNASDSYATSGLMAYWSFDNSTVSGASVSDLSGNGNTATLQATASIVTGHRGQAVQLVSANSDYVSAASSGTLLLTNRVTVACWLKMTPIVLAAHYPMIVGKLTDNTGYAIYYNSDANEIRALYGTSSSFIESPGYTPFATNWYHVCVQNDGTNLKLWINGSQIGSPGTTWSGEPYDSGSKALEMGRHYSLPATYGYIDALIDEVMIYNRALSSAEIAVLAGR